MEIALNKISKIEGIIEVPADKSITHRSIMLSCVACGLSVVKNYLPSDDCKRTIAAFRQMGLKIKANNNMLYVNGAGLKLSKPGSLKYEIFAGNSGTTARLVSGILAGQNFETTITGDASLSKRPMNRITEPLSLMNVEITSENGLLPLTIKGKNPLKAINYKSDKASAQVKSAVLFAGLYADGITSYEEPIKSRDHSERMLKAFGANVKENGNLVSILPADELIGREITVPGDISSAAFFIAAALLVPNSKLAIKNVGINPTRDGIIEVLQKMGACINLVNIRENSGEPTADIEVKYSQLKSANIDAEIVPRMVDEIPIFALIATQANGTTKITGAKELRVKESDRIAAVSSQLSKLGAQIEEFEDGFVIEGGTKLTGSCVDSFDDHRIAMTLAIASLIANGKTIISNAQCVDISFPNFYEILRKVCK
ncbi:MAG: 3-phosphoshikimate 1-carboxyvinyltransferase [Elusimicrobiota bacterium]|jgi:3-phosphoshikimate 1-carboxyvinyltransferase|nr:3-phosphoshikimate 1-carboxyvinyltransferase [Elusimicrobiota bacterium]